MSHSPAGAGDVAIVLATYNERENMERLVPELLALACKPLLFVVDDGSPDGTAQAVLDAARMAGDGVGGAAARVTVIRREGKLGYGSAFVRGFEAALGAGVARVVSMDADFSHDPQSIPDLLAALDAADLAVGSRYVGGIRILNWPMRRLMLSWGANLYINTILRYGIADCTSGFRAYRAEALRQIDLSRAEARGYAFLVQMLEQARRKGLRIVEAPIVYTERREGASKMTQGVILESVFRPWQLLWRRWLGR